MAFGWQIDWQIGWRELKNGELLQQAEDAGYELLLTSDKNIRYQQNLSGRRIAIVVLGNSKKLRSGFKGCFGTLMIPWKPL